MQHWLSLKISITKIYNIETFCVFCILDSRDISNAYLLYSATVCVGIYFMENHLVIFF